MNSHYAVDLNNKVLEYMIIYWLFSCNTLMAYRLNTNVDSQTAIIILMQKQIR